MVAASFSPTTTTVGSTAFAIDLSKLSVGAIIFVTLVVLGVGLRIGRGAQTLATGVGAGGD